MILLSHWRQTACQFIGEAKLCNLASKCIAPEPKALGRLNAASAGRAHGRANERALKLVRQRFPNLRLARFKNTLRLGSQKRLPVTLRIRR